MVDYFSLAQLLGFVSYGLSISTFYQKDDKRLKIIMLIFNINHLIHFLLLGSVVSAVTAALSTLRTATAIYTSSRAVAVVFITLNLVTGLYLAESWWDIWPILGGCIGTFSVFMLSGVKMRIGFLTGASCWLINNIVVGSIGGTLLEATAISINLLTIYRLKRDQAPDVYS